MARQRTTDHRTARFLISLTPEERQRVKIKAVTERVAMGDVARRLLLAWERGEVTPPDVPND